MSTLHPENPIDGFWLPGNIRAQIIDGKENRFPETNYAYLSFCNGQPCQPGDPGAITSRYPVLNSSQWQTLLSMLRQNRQKTPVAQVCWQRFQAALKALGQNFSNPEYPPRKLALNSLPSYTGYSAPMIRMTLNALDMFALDQMPAALNLRLTWQSAQRWQRMPALPGRIRFYLAHQWQGILHSMPGLDSSPLFTNGALPEMVVGYGAGNVPGAALLIAFLALATTLHYEENSTWESAPPVVVVKNSRREPIFSPMILSALEEIDPDLVASMAVLIWDYEDTELEDMLLSQADLVIAAASDETIAQVQSQIKKTQASQVRAAQPRPSRPLHFHAHGHKVSFAAVGGEMLARGLKDPLSGQPLLDIVSLLAALDSIFWDQNGCLSARFHFIERGGADACSAADYAARLKDQLRLLASFLPRGAWPLQQIHDRFDRYKQLEVTGQVQVLSSYQDEFLVALDNRPLSPSALYSLVNDCQGRVIIVRPVESLMEIPNQYLRMLPAANLQSLSIAVGLPGQELDDRLLQFADACGKCGVTAIRTVGRGAFPQLSYSWDGFIPLDLLLQRPAGHFTTLEFDRPYDQILATYQLMQQRAALGLPGSTLG